LIMTNILDASVTGIPKAPAASVAGTSANVSGAWAWVKSIPALLKQVFGSGASPVSFFRGLGRKLGNFMAPKGAKPSGGGGRGSSKHMGPTERQFLPAALEILETPPSPSGRVMTITICALALIGTLWAYHGRIDIVAVAAGKIVTRARIQIVQVSEIGVVKSILVQPGQSVSQGAALIQLDTEAVEAEIERARADQTQARLDIARLRAFVDPLSEFDLESLAGIDPILVERTRLQLAAQKMERQSRLSTLDREREARGAELETAEVLLQKATEILPLVQDKTDIRSKAAQIEFGSKLLDL
jgi:hypothetical protein